MSDNRREPGDEHTARTEIITGIRRRDVVKRLETLSPMPSRPPLDEPGGVIAHIERLAIMHREDVAFGIARTEEQLADLRGEMDDVKAHVLKLAGKVEHLDQRVTIVANTQITHNSAIESLKSSITEMQGTFEGAISGTHARIDMVLGEQRKDRKRLDALERTFGEFRELIMRGVKAQERLLEVEEAKNGTTTATAPPPAGYDPSDPEGSKRE